MNVIEETEYHVAHGINFIKFGEYLQAISEFELAIELTPRHAIAQMKLGWLSYGYLNDLNKAQKHLFIALEIDDTLVDAHMYMGIVQNRLCNTKIAEFHFNKSIVLSKDSSIAHATYAEEFLWHHSRYGEAEEHFKIALKNDPDCIMAIRDYARMLACHGRDYEATALFNKALSIDPNDEYTKKELNLFTEEKSNKNRDPIECLRVAVKKDSNYSEGVRQLRAHGCP